MKAENRQSLEGLSLFCHYSGLVSIFLGFIIIFMCLLSGDLRNVQTGLYIFAVGYTFTKISSKISNIILSEPKEF